MGAHFMALHPVLPARNVAETIQYYTQKLGFRLRFTDAPDDPKYAGVERDGIVLHLQWHEPTTFDHAVDKLALRFVVDDVDALFAEYRDQGVFHAQTAVRDTPWGTREFAFYDLNGNGLFFYRNR